jgi:hypothetical protein
MKITLPVVLDDIKERKDWSSRISFDSRELTEEEYMILRRAKGAEGWMLFSENSLDENDIPDEDAEVDTKTPAQRLRSVLFVRWKQLGEPETFRIYYDKSVEYFINSVKEKLE